MMLNAASKANLFGYCTDGPTITSDIRPLKQIIAADNVNSLNLVALLQTGMTA